MKQRSKSFRTLDLTMISWIHAKGTDKEEKIKKKTPTTYFITIKNFCVSKDTINRVKMQSTEWENILNFQIIYPNPNMSKIYTELLKLNNKKSQTQFKNGQRT